MIFYIIAGILLFILLVYAIFISATFHIAVGRADKFPDIFSEDSAKALHINEKYLPEIRKGADFIKHLPSEDVFIKSCDGLRLHGRLLRAENAKATVILFHGFRSFPEFEFATVAEKYHNRGYNLLLATQRAHGKSEGKYITFGLKERFDCAKWAEYIAKRFPSLPITLYLVKCRAEEQKRVLRSILS